MILRVTLFVLCCSIGAMAAPRKATLAQQKMCADQALKIFHQKYPNAESDQMYTSHYDPDANICYEWLYDLHTIDGKTTDIEQLLDAFENKTYAHFYAQSDQPEPDFCTIFPRNGGPQIHCKSRDAWHNLIHHYFNLDN